MLHIPVDWQKPVEVFDLNMREVDESGSRALEELRDRIFSSEKSKDYPRKIVGMSNWAAGEDITIVSYYDDEGLYNSPNDINIRACASFLGMVDIPLHRLRTPFVGEYILGAINNETGEDVDLPEGLIEDVKALYTSPWITVTDADGNEL